MPKQPPSCTFKKGKLPKISGNFMCWGTVQGREKSDFCLWKFCFSSLPAMETQRTWKWCEMQNPKGGRSNWGIISDGAGGEHSESRAGIRDNPVPLRRKDSLPLPYSTLIPLLRQKEGSDADPEGFSTKEEKFYSLKEFSGFSHFNFINFSFAISQKKS